MGKEDGGVEKKFCSHSSQTLKILFRKEKRKGKNKRSPGDLRLNMHCTTPRKKVCRFTLVKIISSFGCMFIFIYVQVVCRMFFEKGFCDDQSLTLDTDTVMV